MKKTLLSFAVLVLLCTGGMLWAFHTVNAQKDALTFSETALYGDPAAASDLTARFSAECGPLSWTSVCPLRDRSKAQTMMRFSPKFGTASSASAAHTYSGLDLGFNDCSLSAPEGVSLEDVSAQGQAGGLYPVVKDVAGRAKAGETHTETVRLRDYFSVYPMNISADLPGCRGYWNGTESTDNAQSPVLKKIAAYLSIPVREGHQMRVAVTKNTEGQITDLDLSTVADSGLGLWSVSAVTADACYFTLCAYTADGTPLDVSRIPGGYGVYRLPFTTGETAAKLSPDRMSVAYPLGLGAVAESLAVSRDGKSLLLLTRENGGHWLSVLDIQTAQVRQKVFLAAVGPEGETYTVRYVGERFFLAFFGEAFLLAAEENGAYCPVFSGDLTQFNNQNLYLSDQMAAVWDGTRLALGTDQMAFAQNGRLACGFGLAVYDQTGLLCLNRYQSSLFNRQVENSNNICSPVQDQPLSLSWSP